MMENYDELLTENAPAEQSDYDKASWKNRKKAEREEAFASVLVLSPWCGWLCWRLRLCMTASAAFCPSSAQSCASRFILYGVRTA